MKSREQLIKAVLQKAVKPIPKTSVSRWADNYRILSVGLSAEPGKWKTSRAEYQREIMDAFTQTGIHCVVVKSSSQIGKSDIMNNVIGRFAHLDPATIMMVQPTIELAEDYSKGRISPMIRDTKILSKIFYNSKEVAQTRDANQTILSKIFPGGRLIMCGANSPAGLASRPVRVLLCDEVDRFPKSAGNEGDPVGLAAKRMTTFWNHIMGLFSTPTIEGESRIDAEYLKGTQEEWQHQCPNCKLFHSLEYKQMVGDYDENVDKDGNKNYIVRSVKWQCPDCGFEFDEKAMKAAPQKYVAKNPAAVKNGVRSFWVNGFSSPWLSWRGIMLEWYEAKGNPETEKVVMNTRFGLSYKLQGTFTDENEFLRRREDYGAELPNGVLLLTAAVDVQDNRLEYEICGWGVNEECWGIQKSTIPGKPNIKKVWDVLSGILDREYHFADGSALKISRTFIDTGGHFTGAVYDYCKKNLHRQRIGIKGNGGIGLPLNYKTSMLKERGIPLQILGVNDGKQQVMSRLGLQSVGPQYFHFPAEDSRLDFPRGYDEVYFKGLISEQKVIRRSGGIIYSTWEPITKGTRNEPLDLRVYNLACVQSLRVNWRELAKILGEDLPQEVVKPERKTQKNSPRRCAATAIW